MSKNWDLVTFVSHELKTPLSTLKLNIEELKNKISKEDKNLINGMEEELNWMIRFITDTLDLQKTKEKLCFNFGPHKWNEWMRNIQSDIKKKTDLFGRKLKITAPLEETKVYMDPLYIRQVLFNLLMNAVEHSFEKTVIEITWKREKNRTLNVQVADEGPGISMEDKNKLFDFFYKDRKKPDSLIKPTGLGLALAKQIIKAHGGRIQAENRKGKKGALFTFRLPTL